MPKKLHGALEKEARKKGLKGKAKNNFVFGIMTNILKDKKRRKK